MLRVGVLALQGAFALHRFHIETLGAKYVEVVRPQDFAKIDVLILPGGESGTMLKLIEAVGIAPELKQFLKTKPAWGICAGAILMAQGVKNPSQRSFHAIDMEVERNAYGTQKESFEALVWGYPVSFIRAPKIVRLGASISAREKLNEDPIWVESGQILVTTFHPETNRHEPSPWHRRLIKMHPSNR